MYKYSSLTLREHFPINLIRHWIYDLCAEFRSVVTKNQSNYFCLLFLILKQNFHRTRCIETQYNEQTDEWISLLHCVLSQYTDIFTIHILAVIWTTFFPYFSLSFSPPPLSLSLFIAFHLPDISLMRFIFRFSSLRFIYLVLSLTSHCVRVWMVLCIYVYFIYKSRMNRQLNMLITALTAVTSVGYGEVFHHFGLNAGAKLNFRCDISIGTTIPKWNHSLSKCHIQRYTRLILTVAATLFPCFGWFLTPQIGQYTMLSFLTMPHVTFSYRYRRGI